MTALSRAALIKCGEELPSGVHCAIQFSYEMNDEYDHIVDCRNFPDPYGNSLDAYVQVCKWLQDYLAGLYNKICKTLS